MQDAVNKIDVAVQKSDFILARDILAGQMKIIYKPENAGKKKRMLAELDEMLEKTVNKQELTKMNKVNRWDYINIDDAYKLVDVQGHKRKFNMSRTIGNWLDQKHVKIVNVDKMVVNIGWHFYKRMLTLKGKQYLIKKYQIEERLNDYNMVKELSTYMLVNGPKNNDFNYLVGLEHLFGFNVDIVGKSSLKEVKEWVTNKFKPTINGSTSDFLVKFKSTVAKVLRHGDKTLDQRKFSITADHYCNNILLTGTSGSAFDPNGPEPSFSVSKEQIPVKFKKNKYAKSLALSKINKLKRLFTREPIKHKINDKVEVYPKRRIIVSSDYNSTLRMTYIDLWLSRFLNGNDYSSLWRTKKQTKTMWLEFMNYDNIMWNIPIDQSKFDHHVSKDMIIIILDELVNLVKEEMVAEELIKNDCITILDNIKFGLVHGLVVYELKEEDEGYQKGKKNYITIPYENGVLSGWKWTSKFNTIANIAEKLIALEANSDCSVGPELYDATGDDQLTRWFNLCDGYLYWLELSSMGFDIHPSKNFFSTKHNEYLRLFSTEDGINGYPARAINKILWHYPGEIEDKTWSGRLNGTFDKWDKLRTRLLLEWKDLELYMKSDYYGLKIKSDVYNLFLYGYELNGCKQISDKKTIMGQVQYKPGTWKYHINIHADGYESFNTFFGLNQESALNDWIYDVCALSDKDKEDNKIKTEQEVMLQSINTELFIAEEKNFIVREERRMIHEPQIKDGWFVGNILEASERVISNAFPEARRLYKIQNLPKTWYYDYLLGRVELTVPTINKCSKAGLRLLTVKYENSAYNAMLFKRKKMDKWSSITKHYYYQIKTVVESILRGKMFYI